MRKLLVVFMLVSVVALGGSGALGQVISVRGKQWVRSHTFTNAALVADALDMPIWDFQLYRACGFTASCPWQFDGSHPWNGGSLSPKEAQFLADMDANAMIWHFRLNLTSLPAYGIDNTLTAPDKDNGWLITDEPEESALRGLGQISRWLRRNRPNSLVYINVGNTSEGYLENVMKEIQPDVLMYDAYCFNVGGGTLTDLYFSKLMALRSKAKQYGVPLFSWMQAYQADNARLPSESDLRMQIFSSLAVGCKGIMYFLYDNQWPQWFLSAIIQGDGTPTSLYYHVKNVNPEMNRLGRVLRYLESTDVRFIPGKTKGVPNSPWQGLTNWSAGAGEDSRIVSAQVDPSEDGPEKNGLIGLFRDDTGQQYFMLSNIYHGATLSASAAGVGFTVTFDAGTDGLWRLNRETGAQEWVALNNHVLNTTLPGGTGDLYTYSAAGFDLSAPQGSISINRDAATTSSISVTLTLSATDDRQVTHMRFSNDNLAWSEWEPYATRKQLPSGDGSKTVYTQYRDAVGTISATCSDTMLLDTSPPG